MELEVYYVVRYYKDCNKPDFVAGPMSFDDAYDEREKREKNSLGRTSDFRIESGTIKIG